METMIPSTPASTAKRASSRVRRPFTTNGRSWSLARFMDSPGIQNESEGMMGEAH